MPKEKTEENPKKKSKADHIKKKGASKKGDVLEDLKSRIEGKLHAKTEKQIKVQRDKATNGMKGAVSVRKKIDTEGVDQMETVETVDPYTGQTIVGHVLPGQFLEEMGGEEVQIQEEMSTEEQDALIEEWQVDEGRRARRREG